MGRTVAIVWHASSSLVAAILYFVFVLPRWWELTGDVPHGVGTGLRVVAAVVTGLTALPVVFTWLRTRKPEFGVPRLALSLRVFSIVAHVLAGVLIAGTAISEIWLSIDDFGQWQFGVYGAAAAIAVLGIAAFYLSFVAELPPPPPKPLKPKKPKQSRRERRQSKRAEKTGETAKLDDSEESEQPETVEATDDADETGADETDATETGPQVDAAPQTETGAGSEQQSQQDEETTDTEAPATSTTGPSGRLHNRRPTGKTRGRRRGRGAGGEGPTISAD